MSLREVFGIMGSAMQANRLWIDTIANNVANANTTRTDNGDPYRRQQPVFQELVDREMEEMQPVGFGDEQDSEGLPVVPRMWGKGVTATAIVQDSAPFKVVYNPGHPDADTRGFVRMPNVTVIKEMVDMLAAQRNYDASVQMVNAAKTMAQKALEIGR